MRPLGGVFRPFATRPQKEMVCGVHKIGYYPRHLFFGFAFSLAPAALVTGIKKEVRLNSSPPKD
jgi:hypothetical protein